MQIYYTKAIKIYLSITEIQIKFLFLIIVADFSKGSI